MNYRVKKRWPFLGVVFLFATGYLLLGGRMISNDNGAYRDVLEKANPSATLDSGAPYRAAQYRKGIKKSFWYNKGDERLEFLVTSTEAALVFEKCGELKEIVEHLNDVKCYIQEEIFYLLPDGTKVFSPLGESGIFTLMQTIRTIEADTAKYHYTSNRLDAESAKMALYTVPGHRLETSFQNAQALASGSAEFLTVASAEGKIGAKAKRFTGATEVGEISADQAFIDDVSSTGKLPFGSAVFLGNVRVVLKDYGEIHCGKAEIEEKNLLATFSSDAPNEVHMLWDQQFRATCAQARYQIEDGVFTLFEQVKVENPKYGTLEAGEELLIKVDQGKKGALEYVKSSGDTAWVCENEEEDLDFTLRSHGGIFFDYVGHSVNFSSPRGVEGKVEGSKQLVFRDHLGKIYSDDAVITYTEVDGKIVPNLLTLEGNVRLINREGPLLQYALADTVVYTFPTQEMQLFAKEEARILFYDKVNNLQVSAPEAIVKRDKITKKESFQGIGDVRFRFVGEEFERIRKRFLLDKKGL